MTQAYRIRDWSEYYEVSDSKKVEGPLSWVALRTKHDGKGFRRVAIQRERSDLFAAWVLIVQVTAKLPKKWRGWLVDSKGVPLSAEDLSLKTGWPQDAFEKALTYFSDTKQGWIDLVDLPATSARPQPLEQSCATPEPSALAHSVSEAVRIRPDASGDGGSTGHYITGSPQSPPPGAGGEEIKDDRPTRTYPPALAASSAFVKVFEEEWMPYLVERKQGQIPPIMTVDKHLMICLRMGPVRAITALRSAIEKGWAAPDENAKAPRHAQSSTDEAPEGWRAYWREKFPPEDYPDAPRHEDGEWKDIPSDHRRMISDGLRKQERQRAIA